MSGVKVAKGRIQLYYFRVLNFFYKQNHIWIEKDRRKIIKRHCMKYPKFDKTFNPALSRYDLI